MKILKSFAIITLIGLTMMSCTRVAPNHQGVLMENFGQNGKKDFSLKLGRVNTIMWGTELFQVPLNDQRGAFDGLLELKTADNTDIKVRPKYSYTAIPDSAINIVFQNKHLGNSKDFMLSLEDNILEPSMYDILNEASRNFMTDTLMASSGSLRFEKYVEDRVKADFRKRGLLLKTFSSRIEFTDKVTDKINDRNEVNTNITVLDQKIAEQLKKNQLAELQLLEAQIKSRGLTPQILEDKAIEKWSGVLPTTIGGNSIPFIKSIK